MHYGMPIMDFLELQGKTVVVFGVANRRSVAAAVAGCLLEVGAEVIYVVRDDAIRDRNARLFGSAPVVTCNVENEAEVASLAPRLADLCDGVDGVVHSIAFANYSGGFGPFHETRREDFLQAMDISCFSFVAIAKSIGSLLRPGAALVTISISTTRMAAGNYGYMGPIKAALDSSVVFLAQSLAAEVDPDIRVNAVGAGLLKTSSSAGIPGYVDSYLYAEQVMPRKRALATAEVANTVVFLLSPRASGINAQTVIVDAGMSINYFDRRIVRRVVGGE